MRFFLNAQPFGASLEEFDAGVRLPGSDPARFQALLERMRTAAVIAEEGGMEGVCWSEQHCNTEGVPENTSNPILFGAFVGNHTKRLKVGQLGMTLTANHPLRVAEDLAMLDQMTNGRMFCGFTRGNATRWVNTFAEHFGLAATKSDKSEADERNLRAIKEAWAIIKAAWTQETFHFEGEFWTIPAHDTEWAYPATATHGAGMSEDGQLHELGITPRPLHFPRVFSPLAFRMTTARFWAAEGATAVCYTTRDDFLATAASVLGEEAANAGYHDVPPLAPGAMLLLGRDSADVAELQRSYDELFRRFYTVPPFNIPGGRLLVGTADDVCRQIDSLLEVFHFEDIFLWHNIGFVSDAVENGALEELVSKVMPRYGS